MHGSCFHPVCSLGHLTHGDGPPPRPPDARGGHNAGRCSPPGRGTADPGVLCMPRSPSPVDWGGCIGTRQDSKYLSSHGEVHLQGNEHRQCGCLKSLECTGLLSLLFGLLCHYSLSQAGLVFPTTTGPGQAGRTPSSDEGAEMSTEAQEVCSTAAHVLAWACDSWADVPTLPETLQDGIARWETPHAADVQQYPSVSELQQLVSSSQVYFWPAMRGDGVPAGRVPPGSQRGSWSVVQPVQETLRSR